MKIILFASALALSTAAIAQDATAPATPPADATAPAAPMTPDATAPATPDASAPAAAPDATAPAATPDATAPAAAPMTGDSSGNMASATSSASSVDDSNLPMCSKSVTDKCKQGGGKGGHHKMMRHKKK